MIPANLNYFTLKLNKKLKEIYDEQVEVYFSTHPDYKELYKKYLKELEINPHISPPPSLPIDYPILKEYLWYQDKSAEQILNIESVVILVQYLYDDLHINKTEKCNLSISENLLSILDSPIRKKPVTQNFIDNIIEYVLSFNRPCLGYECTCTYSGEKCNCHCSNGKCEGRCHCQCFCHTSIITCDSNATDCNSDCNTYITYNCTGYTCVCDCNTCSGGSGPDRECRCYCECSRTCINCYCNCEYHCDGYYKNCNTECECTCNCFYTNPNMNLNCVDNCGDPDKDNNIVFNCKCDCTCRDCSDDSTCLWW
jgi:hypothetical protein